MKEVALAHRAVSGDGTKYLTLVTRPLSQASRGWPLTEAFIRLALGCLCVEGAFGGTQICLPFPGRCSGHPLSFPLYLALDLQVEMRRGSWDTVTPRG